MKEKGIGIMKEFKEFISRGNVVDMAVGIIMGSAFTGIVNSLVADIITPLLDIITGGLDFTFMTLSVGHVELLYGAFIEAVINFLLIALVLFLLIKFINKLRREKKKEEAPPAPATKKCDYCKSEIAIDATRCPHCTSVLEDK